MQNDQQLMRRQSGEIQQTVTQGYSSASVAVRDDSAVESAAAEARATIEARFIMALRRPRDVEGFRTLLLKEAERPTLAAVAIYRKPVGKKDGKQQYVEGLSVHFIRTAKALYRNIHVDNSVTFENSMYRKIRVQVLDAEACCTESTEIVIEKTVERRYADNREIVGERENSGGDKVYIVKATEDELLVKQRAMIAKAERTLTEHLLPRDIMDEARAHIEETQRKADAKDPDAGKRQLLDAFTPLGVAPSDIAAYLGHTADRMSPAEIKELRGVYSSLKNGEATWDEIMQAKNTTPEPELQQEVKGRLIADAAAKQKPVTVTQPEGLGVSEADLPPSKPAALTADQEPSGYAKEPAPAKRKGFV